MSIIGVVSLLSSPPPSDLLRLSMPGKGSLQDSGPEAVAVPDQVHAGTAHDSTLGLLLRAARPKQWLKNLLVFMAPAAAGVLGEWHTALLVVLSFLIFCLAASGTYLVNDVLDSESDRHHPIKRSRPVASGALGRGVALGVGAALITTAVVSALLVRPWGFAAIVASYVGLSIAYSLRLKREPVMELAAVAACFVLRAVAGGVVAHVSLSKWFLVFTSFAALFIVTGKRCAEYSRLGDSRGVHRAVLDEYSESFLKSTLTIAATVTVASYCLWAFERGGLLAHAGTKAVWIELTVVPLVLSVLHILRLLDAGKGGEPEQLALHESVLQGYGVLWLALMSIGLYG